MKTISKIKYLFFIAVIAAFVSCEGPAGPAGADGVDGQDGIDGQDGNANVQTYIYNNPSWNSHGASMQINMSGILTDSVIANDAILIYVQHTYSGSSYVNIIPGTVRAEYYRNYIVFLNTGDLQITSLEMDGSYTPNANLWPVDWVKVVIIESTNVTSNKSLNPQQEILYNLDKAGVDINNYYQVMDYYGLDY